MNTLFRLSSEEMLVLEPILSRQSKRAQRPITLTHLLERWSKFVSQVEGGYQDSIYEYMNDLSVRDLLQELLDNCPSNIRPKLLSMFKIWDDRFEQASRKLEKSLLSSLSEGGEWWWFRIPLEPGDELKNDLQTDGLW